MAAELLNPAVEGAAGLATCPSAGGDTSGATNSPGRVGNLRGCTCDGFVRTKGSPTPYALRHTYAAFMLAAFPTDTVARFMGTSVSQIEDTYGHLLPNSADLLRRRANEYLRDLRAAEAARESAATR